MGSLCRSLAEVRKGMKHLRSLDQMSQSQVGWYCQEPEESVMAGMMAGASGTDLTHHSHSTTSTSTTLIPTPTVAT